MSLCSGRMKLLVFCLFCTDQTLYMCLCIFLSEEKEPCLAMACSLSVYAWHALVHQIIHTSKMVWSKVIQSLYASLIQRYTNCRYYKRVNWEAVLLVCLCESPFLVETCNISRKWCSSMAHVSLGLFSSNPSRDAVIYTQDMFLCKAMLENLVQRQTLVFRVWWRAKATPFCKCYHHE